MEEAEEAAPEETEEVATEEIEEAIPEEAEETIPEEAEEEATPEETEEVIPEETEEEAIPEETEEVIPEETEEEAATEEAEEVIPEETEEEAATEETEEAIPEEADEEKPQVTEEYSKGTLTYSEKDVVVTLDYDIDAEIPEGAALSVKEISSKSKEYSTYIERTASEVLDEEVEDNTLPYARFFDITILSKDGEEIEPAAPVEVKIELKDDALATEDVDFTAVHFAEEGNRETAPEIIPIEIEETEEAQAVTFETDSFSVYGVVYYYTVDFYYTDKNDKTTEYHMNGGTKMMLSELFEKLTIERDTADIKTVEFTDDSLLTFTKSGKDYEIKSLKAFTSDEELTITFKDGEVIRIGVEDAVVTASAWDDLKTAVENAGDGDEITIESDIVIPDGETLEVKKNITIKGADGGVTISREVTSIGASELGPMIQVTSGKLTLGENLTFSGKRGDSGDDRYWWKEDFKYDASGLPQTRGFFVQVESTGGLVVDGATFEGYATAESTPGNRTAIPSGVSPIFVAGDFTMNSGTVQNNFAGAVNFYNWKWFIQYKDNTFLTWEDGTQADVNGADNVIKNGSDWTVAQTTSGGIYIDAPGKTLQMNGGTITNNKGNAGNLVVAGGTLTIKDNTNISKGWGDHFSGGIYAVTDDAEVRMCGGLVSENESPMGGGVFVSNNAAFFLMGGKIDSNKSLNTGGGILVYSNKVYLLSGTISNNAAPVFGGGVYVYGNDTNIDQQYVLTMHNAEITGNEAVASDSDPRIKGWDLLDGPRDASLFMRGSGGGVWLCPAGVSEFDGSTFNLYYNKADRQGKDFHKDAGFEGGLLLDFGPHEQLNDWIHDELQGNWNSYSQGPKYGNAITEEEATSGSSDSISLENQGKTRNADNPQLFITNNVSLRGGGIGSNGVLILSDNTDDRDIDKGELKFKKEFKDLDPKKMEYEMIFADENGKPVIENGKEVVILTFRLFDQNYNVNCNNKLNIDS